MGSQLHQGHIKPLTELVEVGVEDDPADVQKVLFLVEVYFPHLDPEQGWVGILAVGGQNLVAQRQMVRGSIMSTFHTQQMPPGVSHLWMQWAAVRIH